MKRGKFIYKEGEVAPFAANELQMLRRPASHQQKSRAADRRPASLTLLGRRYLTNTEIVPLTVWPPGPYAVKVYTELVIGVTVKLPLAGRLCAPTSLPIRTTEVAFCVVHERTTGLPAAVEVTGLAVNDSDPHRSYVDRRVSLYLAGRVGRRQGVGGGQRSG